MQNTFKYINEIFVGNELEAEYVKEANKNILELEIEVLTAKTTSQNKNHTHSQAQKVDTN